MKKSKKEHIETYIFAPDLLSKEKKLEIEQWLKESEELRAVAAWYSSFKKEIRFIKKSKSKKRPASSKIEVLPAPVVKKIKHSFTLAAKTPEAKTGKAGIQTLRTFISEENKAIVRVIRENGGNRVQIHAISENIESDDIAMLRIPGVAELLISKPGGVFSLGDEQFSEETVRNWDSCTLFIPMDRADLLLNPDTGRLFLDTHRSDKELLSVSISEEKFLVKVHLKCEEDFYIDKVIVSNGEKGYLFLINDDVIDLPRTFINNKITTLFFFN